MRQTLQDDGGIESPALLSRFRASGPARGWHSNPESLLQPN
jgi:hypothetical protein